MGDRRTPKYTDAAKLFVPAPNDPSTGASAGDSAAGEQAQGLVTKYMAGGWWLVRYRGVPGAVASVQPVGEKWLNVGSRTYYAHYLDALTDAIAYVEGVANGALASPEPFTKERQTRRWIKQSSR